MIVRNPWYPEVDPVIRNSLRQEGLHLAGITSVHDNVEEEEEQYRRWLGRGYHGAMRWMEKHAALKFHPERLLPGTRSIVFIALNYYQKRTDAPPEPSGRLARYAWGRDYHKELGKRIKRVARQLQEQFPDEQFRSWTDATPLAERFYAERAGIGFTGRHTLLINGQFGSWFVVGEILTTIALDPSESAGTHHGACPLNCTRCIDVCPTGALLGPHRIDGSRCISYLTIEHRGVIPEELRPLMGDWIFGCDLCQEVCPLNVRATVTDVAGFLKPIAGDRQLLKDILEIRTEEEFRSRFAGSPVMRAGREGLVRNACIAAANLGARELIEELKICADDGNEVVAIHARWALSQLESTDE